MLQYITQDIPAVSHQQLVESACAAGIKWVQLRTKHYCFDDCRKIAEESLAITKNYGAKLIINDFLEVALAVKANGVHLGKEDMAIPIAKKMIPPGFILGGTANNFEDVKRLASEGVHYIGLGPYKFTATKAKLSPILGISGYHKIMDQVRGSNITTPIVAIGGILSGDVNELMQTGIAGIAVSSAISYATDKKAIITQFNKGLNSDKKAALEKF
jgi:thiamine-phosphate pyrophosphorylase